ncbi:MAG: FkbM family methyltransferase [Planctomycetota bacterium]
MKQLIRGLAKPIVRRARTWLEPPPVKVVDRWCTISAGPAEGADILLPYPSGFADKIVPGQYEIPCTSIMQALVSRDSVCLDIGGHYGYFTLVLASLAPEGRVETFEPLPNHAKRIADSADRSGLAHVKVHQKAVADISSTMTLRYVSSGNYDSMAYLESRGGVVSEASKEQYPTFESCTVETTTLDALSPLEPSFIKVDAEGAEAAILRGGTNLLANQKPRLLIEIHGIREAFECAEVLRDVGYQVFAIGEPDTTLPVLCLSSEDPIAKQTVDQALHPALTMIFNDQSR